MSGHRLGHSDPICRTFEFLGMRTWLDMQDATMMGHALGEESLTDFLLLDLRRSHPLEVKIIKFDKIKEGRTTGADWEWWFGGTVGWFGIRVQAKKIDKKHIYSGLPKNAGKSRKKQVNLLIDDAKARGLYPLYCFYNYWDSLPVALPWMCSSFTPRTERWGCSVADAYAVKEKIKANTLSIVDIAPISLPWTCLVCCRFYAGQSISLPEGARGIALELANKAVHSHNVPALLPRPPFYVTTAESITAEKPRPLTQEQLNFAGDVDGILVIREVTKQNEG